MPKLSLEIAREIRSAWEQGKKAEELGRRYQVSVSTITAIVKGDIWKEPNSSSGSIQRNSKSVVSQSDKAA